LEIEIDNPILKDIENTLTEFKYNIPMNNYLSLVKEYRDTCVKLNRLLTKEKDRNRKFVTVKRELTESHNKEMKNLQHDIDDQKRVIAKCKEMVITNEKKNVVPEDNLKNIRQDIDRVIAEHFSGQKIDIILNKIVQDLTSQNQSFDFHKVDLHFLDYHKITVLQRSIYKIVMATIETNSTSVVSAITNTILRNKYRYIHQRLAKKVLEASHVSRGVFKFFGDIFIEQTDGKRWSSFAITRFMGEYFTQISLLKKIDKELSEYINQNSDIRTVVDESELELNEEYEKTQMSRKLDKAINKLTVKLSEEQLKFSDMKLKYDDLLDAVIRVLLEKRRTI